MILEGQKPSIIGNDPGEVAFKGDRIGAGDGLPADFDFSAPLTYNLTLERGVGPAVFSRTTTGFVQDNLDIFNLIDIAAARFKGARYLGSGLFSNLDSSNDPIPGTTLKGFLSEDQRTNILLRTRNFNTAPWIGFSNPVLTQDQIGIDGQVNKAWTFTDNNPTAFLGILQDSSIISDSNMYAASFFIKKDNDETRFPRFDFILSGGTTQSIFIQLNTKTGAFIIITSIGTVNVTVIDVGLWWLVVATVQNNSTNTNARSRLFAAASTIFGGSEASATGSIIIDMAGIELNYGSSPIETIASTVTRTLDRLQYPVVGNIEVNNISCFIKWTPAQDNLGTVFIWASYVDANNYTALLHDGTNLIARKRIAGVNNDATIALDYDNNVSYKIGWRFSTIDGIDIWLDGIKGINNANITNLQLGVNFEIGSDGNSANHDFSYHKENEIWNRLLSDSEMAAFTS